MACVLLIVGGGIAAYKALELVRLLKKAGHEVSPVLTKGGEHFVTAMSLGTLAEAEVHTSLWELKDEVEIGHIQLSRAADFVLVCPATADLLAKRASGRQGFAIAEAAAAAGARVRLIAGPVALETPPGVERIDVETAEQMAEAVFAALPADAAIMVAAVADWRVEESRTKLKKRDGPPSLELVATRDILAELGQSKDRPRLLIGFAAETENVVEQAVAKRTAK